jgi:hypothetical protein
MPERMKTSEVCRQEQIEIHNVRNWLKTGKLVEPSRDCSGHFWWSQADVRQLRDVARNHRPRRDPRIGRQLRWGEAAVTVNPGEQQGGCQIQRFLEKTRPGAPRRPRCVQARTQQVRPCVTSHVSPGANGTSVMTARGTFFLFRERQ